MKILLLILPLLFQYWEESAAVKSFRLHVEEICLAANEGRAAGSDGEKAVADYVYNVFRNSGMDVISGAEGDTFGVLDAKGDTLVSRNVIAFAQGYDPDLKGRFIVVGARMDGMGTHTMTVDGVPVEQIYAGANGNASGLAMLLELAPMFARQSLALKRSVVFVAFGSSGLSFAGSWHFLHHTFGKDVKNIDAMINLDILGADRDGMMAYTCGNEDLNMMINTLASSFQPVKPRIVSSEPYPSDHQVFYASEIPSVLFTSGRYPEHNTVKDTPGILDFDFMEREKEYIYNFICEIANAAEGMPSFRSVDRTAKKQEGAPMPWSDCDTPPMFLNSPNPSVFLEKWVYPYLKYPQSCIAEGIQGRVMVEFTIQADGRLTDAHVVRSVDPQLDEAALKVISASPKWRPARFKGKKVACSMTIPVEFRLKKKK